MYTNMRICICDDDTLILEQLQKYIRSYFDNIHVKCPEIACFTNGESLLADNENMDILFLDVEMPGMNGIYIGNELKKRNPNIIILIITSYIEYLDDAMRFHVFRYLSKPLDKQRLFRNMKDALELYHHMGKTLPIETRQGVYTLPASSIIAVETLEKKTIVHTTKQDFESIHPIQYWEDVLPKNRFIRTHRSFIVNFGHVSAFDHSTIYLNGGQLTAYLTRRKYTSFKKAYLLYLESMR